LWFYKHQQDNRLHSKLFVACWRWWFQWRLATILVNCAPSEKMHNYCTPHIIKENSENFLIHQCNSIFLSQVYCIWQAVKTPTIILHNPVYSGLVLKGLIIPCHLNRSDVTKQLENVSQKCPKCTSRFNLIISFKKHRKIIKCARQKVMFGLRFKLRTTQIWA
jgi:hypothetical protein